MDQSGETLSADKRSFYIPPAEGKLALSSVSVVRQMKDKDQNTNPNDPWLLGDKLVSPTLQPTVKKGEYAVSALLFGYLHRSTAEGCAACKPMMEFTKDDKVLGGGPRHCIRLTRMAALNI